MTEEIVTGHFYVTELQDGIFVAASNYSPYFCFRADSEEAVKTKVKEALTFYRETQSAPKKVVTRPPARIHNWANRRATSYSDPTTAAVA